MRWLVPLLLLFLIGPVVEGQRRRDGRTRNDEDIPEVDETVDTAQSDGRRGEKGRRPTNQRRPGTHHQPSLGREGNGEDEGTTPIDRVAVEDRGRRRNKSNPARKEQGRPGREQDRSETNRASTDGTGYDRTDVDDPLAKPTGREEGRKNGHRRGNQREGDHPERNGNGRGRPNNPENVDHSHHGTSRNDEASQGNVEQNDISYLNTTVNGTSSGLPEEERVLTDDKERQGDRAGRKERPDKPSRQNRNRTRDEHRERPRTPHRGQRPGRPNNSNQPDNTRGERPGKAERPERPTRPNLQDRNYRNMTRDEEPERQGRLNRNDTRGEPRPVKHHPSRPSRRDHPPHTRPNRPLRNRTTETTRIERPERPRRQDNHNQTRDESRLTEHRPRRPNRRDHPPHIRPDRPLRNSTAESSGGLECSGQANCSNTGIEGEGERGDTTPRRHHSQRPHRPHHPPHIRPDRPRRNKTSDRVDGPVHPERTDWNMTSGEKKQGERRRERPNCDSTAEEVVMAVKSNDTEDVAQSEMVPLTDSVTPGQNQTTVGGVAVPRRCRESDDKGLRKERPNRLQRQERPQRNRTRGEGADSTPDNGHRRPNKPDGQRSSPDYNSTDTVQSERVGRPNRPARPQRPRHNQNRKNGAGKPSRGGERSDGAGGQRQPSPNHNATYGIEPARERIVRPSRPHRPQRNRTRENGAGKPPRRRDHPDNNPQASPDDSSTPMIGDSETTHNRLGESRDHQRSGTEDSDRRRPGRPSQMRGPEDESTPGTDEGKSRRTDRYATCEFGDWADWSDCQYGIRRRIRAVISGPRDCVNKSHEYQSCST